MKVLLFTTPTCIKCKKVKDFLSKQNKFTVELVDASTPSGLDLAKKYEVFGVPAVVFFDGDTILGVATDIDEVEQYL
jgi:glutaredoxin